MDPEPIEPELLDNKPLENEEEETEIKTLNHQSLFYSYIQRYYNTYESPTQYVHMHSNGLFLIRLKVAALPASPTQIVNLLEPVEVRGKKKKGGVKVKADTVIAEVKCQNGESFKVLACVEGTVIENNDRISLQNLGSDDGYFVIIQPNRRFVPEQVGMTRIFYRGNS